MSVTEYTLKAIAKYTPDQLMAVGRFNLRMLAMQAGIFRDEDRKTAFLAMSISEQAMCILDTIRPPPDPLIEELNDAGVVDKYRRTCVELAEVMRSMRRT